MHDIWQSALTFLFGSFVSLFVIVDPFAVVPVYLSLTEKFNDEATRRIRRKASFIALGMLLTFALTGLLVFRIFGISLAAFQIAGGLLLFVFGFEQLRATRQRVRPEEQDEGLAREDVSVFPLATPLLAGPGAISTVILESSRTGRALDMAFLSLAIAAVVGSSYVTLKLGPLVFRLIGQTGLNILTRIMGLLLTAIAIQHILLGVQRAIVDVGSKLP